MQVQVHQVNFLRHVPYVCHGLAGAVEVGEHGRGKATVRYRMVWYGMAWHGRHGMMHGLANKGLRIDRQTERVEWRWMDKSQVGKPTD